jgi:DNA-directed RNA polymerase specialized sigma24 family protein
VDLLFEVDRGRRAGGTDPATLRTARLHDLGWADVAAETFLIAFDRRDRYDVAHPFARPWLYGIASNLVSRHHRAEIRRYKALARVGVDEATDGHVDQRPSPPG